MLKVMCARMYACVFVFLLCMYACMHVSIYEIGIVNGVPAHCYVCMYECKHMYVCIRTRTHMNGHRLLVRTCMCVCMYVCMYDSAVETCLKRALAHVLNKVCAYAYIHHVNIHLRLDDCHMNVLCTYLRTCTHACAHEHTYIHHSSQICSPCHMTVPKLLHS
jgi:hypothetical protein